MGQFICHHNGGFNIFNTISDGFRWTEAIDENTLCEWYAEEYGRRGVEELPARLDRAKAKGTSCHDSDLAAVLACNRAGKNERELSVAECVRQFLTLSNRPSRPAGAGRRQE